VSGYPARDNIRSALEAVQLRCRKDRFNLARIADTSYCGAYALPRSQDERAQMERN
jgi:hypothetical protein